MVCDFPAGWGPESSLGQYGDVLRKNFEEAMFNEITFWFPSLILLEWHRDMARYFARFEVGDGNLYHRLLDHLHSSGLLDRVVVVSLNYDCLPEKAASALG